MVADVLLTALAHAWKTLDAAGMRMAVMGGIALASWKYVRATRDVDLLVGPAESSTTLIVFHYFGCNARISTGRICDNGRNAYP